jgi:hypothetical protein
VIALSTILEVAAERRDEIRALTTGSRMRAIAEGHAGEGEVLLDYELTNRGNEPVWMPDSVAPGGFSEQNVPVWLEWVATRTTARPVGYLMHPAMAEALPRLLDQDIAVYRFTGPATIDAEVYHATAVRTSSYFQGAYLKEVEAVKETQALEVSEGWFWIPTAQSMGNLISYLMEPETDDNLITWGYADHVLQETPGSVEEVVQGMMQGQDPDMVTEQQRQQFLERAEQIMSRRQRVPMMRVMTHQELPVVRVQDPHLFQRTRFWR